MPDTGGIDALAAITQDLPAIDAALEAAPSGEDQARYDRKLHTALASDRITRRETAASVLAKLLVVAPRSFPASRRRLAVTLTDDAPAVRRAAADAVVSLAQTDPSAFDRPTTVADRLREVLEELDFGRLDTAAIQEGIDALDA